MITVRARSNVSSLCTTLTSTDGDAEIEAPETPAPVFAARALKSAIFGTPALPDDETIYEIETEEEEADTMGGKDTKNSQVGSISPIKPQGILLTPGTATSRRKTVSFGHEVLEKAEKNANEKVVAKSGTSAKHHSSAESRLDQPSKSNRLTKALEDAREERTRRSSTEKSRNSSESKPLLDLESKSNDDGRNEAQSDRRASKSQKSSSQDLMQELMNGEKFDGDITVDLNEPHSQSGKYWKNEFQQYHEEAQAEMKKLTKYKNLAKSYAKKKDAEALNLAEKLKEEQRRVVSMEDKISKLSAQIANTGLDGQEDDSPEMIKELARQTALAVQYRAQVEEFRAALEGNEEQPNSGKRLTSPRTEQTLLDTHRELKKAREQLKEMSVLRTEMRGLKQSLTTTEGVTRKLQDENTKLTQELLHADLRLEKEVEKSEKRRQSWQERLQKKDEALQSLQKDYDTLKEAAKSQRRDAEQLLRKRHDQTVELKKEIASLKGAESTAKALQQALQTKISDHNQIVADYKRQIERLISTQAEDTQAVTLPSKAALGQLGQATRSAASSNENLHSRESHIPVLSQSVAQPSKTVAAMRLPRSETPAGSPRPGSSNSALSEITNGASSERLPLHTSSSNPLVNRFSNMSLEEPDMELPSPEPSMLSHLPGRTIHEKNCHASPRPSMFVIPSSPPKPAMMRSRTSGELARQRSITTLANVASSRLSSLEGSRTRNPLPPERAAAAKARLEQKNAEKKRAQAMGGGKENILI